MGIPRGSPFSSLEVKTGHPRKYNKLLLSVDSMGRDVQWGRGQAQHPVQWNHSCVPCGNISLLGTNASRSAEPNVSEMESNIFAKEALYILLREAVLISNLSFLSFLTYEPLLWEKWQYMSPADLNNILHPEGHYPSPAKHCHPGSSVTESSEKAILLIPKASCFRVYGKTSRFHKPESIATLHWM